MRNIILILILFAFTACTLPIEPPPPPTAIPSDTLQPASISPTVAPATSTAEVLLPTETPPPSADFCQDTRVLQLIQNLQTAIQTRDGKLLVSLIDPNAGVAVQYIRNGNEIVYHDNFKFVFETTYEADWGLGAGSGAPVTGSFQEIVLPSLQKVFSSKPVLTCNSLKVGGATYIPEWPHPGMDFYSVYFPGTEQYGNMDWETWSVGVARQGGQPVLAALVHYAWEP